MGTDASWDLRNYHIYNAFAILHGKFLYDIDPAQLQSYFNPTLDVLYYLVRRHLNHFPALVNILLSVPQAVVSFIAFLIALKLIPERTTYRYTIGILVTILGATGAASLPTISAATGDSIPAIFLLGGVLFLMTDAAYGSRELFIRLALAGLLFGTAAGLKLTELTYCIGAQAALFICSASPWGNRIRECLLFGVGVLVGLLIVGGPWMLFLSLQLHNPIFPLFNDIFRSPMYDFVALADNRFKPRNWSQEVFYPFYWISHPQTLVSELKMRDPRFAMAYLSTILSLFLAATHYKKSGGRPLKRSHCVLIAFFGFSYIAWQLQFSIFRYLAPIEALCGAIVLIPLLRVPTLQKSGVILLAMLLLVDAGAVAWTVYPNWGRSAPSERAVDVKWPAIPAMSLVILLDGSPMAYVAAFAPRSVRFIGANNNMMRPGQRNQLAEEIKRTIGSFDGPLYGLEPRSTGDGLAQATLAFYGLHLTEACMVIISNLDSNSLRICRLSPQA
jgi:hypothetical protein